MIKINKIESVEKVEKLRGDYIKTLGEPIDGYWENIIIGYSQCFEITYGVEPIGHCSISDDTRLLQFHVFAEYKSHSKEIFDYLIKSGKVSKAGVSTKEPEFLSLCLDYQKNLRVDMYLFSDTKKIYDGKLEFRDETFRLATENDINIIKKECDEAFNGYYENLIKNDQLFVMYDHDSFMGIGEFRIIESNSKYGDIGITVSDKHRNKGIGTYIFTKLRKHCHKNNLKALSCCNANNIGSKKTMEKSGMVSLHRIVYIDFL